MSLLTFSEIDAFQRLTHFTFTAWEIEMIEMLDHLYISEHAKARESDG